MSENTNDKPPATPENPNEYVIRFEDDTPETEKSKNDLQPRGPDGKFLPKSTEPDPAILEIKKELEALRKERESERKAKDEAEIKQIKEKLKEAKPSIYEKWKDSNDLHGIKVALETIIEFQAPQKPPAQVQKDGEKPVKIHPPGYVGGYNSETGEWD